MVDIGLTPSQTLVEEDKVDEEDTKQEALMDVKAVKAQFKFTREQEDDLLEAFNLLDHTGEGKIKVEDFKIAIKALGYAPTNEEIHLMISAVDKNSTGKINFKEFQTAIMRKVMCQDSDGDIMKSFRLFNMDDSGYISFENIKNVSQILGTNITDEEIDEMIDDTDKDFDGFISCQEFMNMMKNGVHMTTP